ncbi:rubredoxin [Nitrospirota bacterium]
MSVKIDKILGGFMVDGLELRTGKCGCTSFAECCYTWSKVKKRPHGLEFKGKTATPESKEVFEWSYQVEKDDIRISVEMMDARDKVSYSGFMPPSVKEWADKGWTVLESSGDREDGDIYRCSMCKWLYNEDAEGTPFADLPDDWKCPTCSATKNSFEKI